MLVARLKFSVLLPFREGELKRFVASSDLDLHQLFGVFFLLVLFLDEDDLLADILDGGIIEDALDVDAHEEGHVDARDELHHLDAVAAELEEVVAYACAPGTRRG